MIILAIDTSCDDTCAAILKVEKWKFEIKSNIVSSQIKIHQKYGGVYPTLAKREHQRNLVRVLKESLSQARLLKRFKIQSASWRTNVKSNLNSKVQNLKIILEREEVLFKKLREFLEKYQIPKIDVIAVTIGPGLDPCLWQGVNFARALSYFWNLPVIPINHIEAHIFANFLELQVTSHKLQEIFPAICLVVSGGHTQLILMKGIGNYKIIGETRDDAAGECLDKTARVLGLPYPGGPAIAQQSAQWKSKCQNPNVKSNPKSKIQNLISNIHLPRPMLKSKDYDFSFSGLKTAVLYDFRKRLEKVRTSKKYIREMAKEIQQAVIDVLIKKTIVAAQNYKAKTIILGGGVAANKELRKQIKEKIKKNIPDSKLLIPNPNLCTDNAVMIGVAGYFNENKKKNWKQIKVKSNLRI